MTSYSKISFLIFLILSTTNNIHCTVDVFQKYKLTHRSGRINPLIIIDIQRQKQDVYNQQYQDCINKLCEIEEQLSLSLEEKINRRMLAQQAKLEWIEYKRTLSDMLDEKVSATPSNNVDPDLIRFIIWINSHNH